jgi:DnaJ-class molecular chaperone
MNLIRTHRLRTQGEPGTPPLSPEQQRFNQLIEQIEQHRARLAAWQQVVEDYRHCYQQEYLPLQQQLSKQQARLVQLFNQAYDNRKLSKRAKKQLSDMIITLAAAIPPEQQSAEIRQIIRMHDADSPQISQQETSSEPQNHPLAPQVDSDGREAWEQAAEQRQQQKQQRQASRKAEKAQKKLQQQAPLEDASRSLRAVYRKLASTLHPDRAQSETERVHMTSMMQRVNLAYGSKNLLQLLQLQLEIEQIDQQALQALDQTRLQHYNQTFSEQLQHLQQEISDIEQRFCLPPPTGKTMPETVLRQLRGQIRQRQEDIRHLAHQLALFEQPAYLDSWLRNVL